MRTRGGGGTLPVPIDGMVIKGGTYYGISKAWYEKQNPSNDVLSLSLKIPDNVTTILNDGFRDSYSSDKENQGVVTNYNYDGDKTYTDKYEVVSIDFSEATSLKTIGNQAAMGCTSLEGVLDLSNTKIETIGKSAFSGCTELTGVILPSTLEVIGTEDANSGSVFKGCSGLQYVRVEGGDPDAAFELPNALKVLGKDSFYGCTGLPDGTTVIIPESVEKIGSQAFYNTSKITNIILETEDASGYHGTAFKANNYGLNVRLTVFKSAEVRDSYVSTGNSTYTNSLTFEFTLHYGSEGDTDAETEQKLCNQAVNVCKNVDGSWYIDDDYSIPSCTGNAPIGYDLGWEYNGKILTDSTVLKPSGDDLYLDVGIVLKNPDIEFIVDGKIIDVEGTYPELNLSNDKEHKIGVVVSHPIEQDPNADVKVKFEYEWTDVWKGGSQGPRMSEEGFGRYNLFDNPGVSNTIAINGPTHERTKAGSYSEEDYGDGYYLLEIYGYSCPKSGGQWKLFYKSASTVIGSDPERTVNTAYLFDVVTSDPVVVPIVTVDDVAAEYGYGAEEAVLTAVHIEQDGHTYQYQWYEASQGSPSADGTPIEGATESSYTIPAGKGVESYYYYVEVTAKKTLNGDEATVAAPATFTVNAHRYSIIVNPTDHGSYEVPQTSAPEGTAVIITVCPETGYHANAPTVTDYYGNALTLTEVESGWQFAMPASDVIICGSFELNQYTITFHDGDNKIIQHYNHGDVIIPPDDPVRESTESTVYTFTEWNGYSDGMIAIGDAEFHAQYSESARVYIITFFVSGEVYWKNPQEYGQTIELPETEPSMSGYVFRGWSGYDDGMTVSSDHTFFAVFESVPNPSPPEIVPIPPWDDDSPIHTSPNIVVDNGKYDDLWIFVVLGSVATLLFLLFMYFERRNEED